MKKDLSFIIANSLLVIVMFSCTKSESISTANKNEFGNITQFDSIVAYSTLSYYSYYFGNDGTIDSIYNPDSKAYYYFKYNSDGLPISGSGGFIQLSSATGYTSPIFIASIKDTLIYTDNHTIEINTFSEDPQYSYNKKTLCTFNNGYLIQRIDFQSNGFNDTTTFTYNTAHQLISTLYFDNKYSATKTDYTYAKDTVTATAYHIDRTTGQRDPNYISESSWWSTGTGSNPYYKQEWLKMWPELIDKTLSPYN